MHGGTSMHEGYYNGGKLRMMTPFNNDEVAAILPNQLLGLKRTEISLGDHDIMHTTSAEAEYSNGNNKEIKVKIIDGASKEGSRMFSTMMTEMNRNSEKMSAGGFEKMTVVNGYKAIVSENKKEKEIKSKIQMMMKDRYMIMIEGEGYNSVELEKALEELNTAVLK